MRNMLFVMICFVSFFLSNSPVRAEKKVVLPRGFVQTVIPSGEHRYSLSSVSGSLSAYIPKLENNELMLCEYVRGSNYSGVRTFDIPDRQGTLIGINQGEWGGALYYLADLSTKMTQVLHSNVRFMFFAAGKTYVLTGLSHLGYTEGHLYSIVVKYGDMYGVLGKEYLDMKEIADFGDSPVSYCIHGDDLYVHVGSKFIIMRNFTDMEVVLDDLDWIPPYDTNIAVFDEKNIFLGIKSGFVSIDAKNKSCKYYRKE